MTRRTVLTAAAAAPALAWQPGPAPKKYQPDWESLRRHPVPAWFDDAKLGIFIHWGLYSVPAWAPPTGELGKVDWSKWFYQNPYAEWYLNSLRLKESPTYAHHAKTYGADYDYYRFAERFNSAVERWDPSTWASLFRKTGARYAVLTTKHHDGFTLWPSRVKNPKRPEGVSAKRDLVGDLTKAVRGAGLRMGLYYSGGLDWTFEESPVATLADLRRTVPQSPEYAAYADAHWRELMDRYQPAVLWNDINYPKLGRLPEIFADFYNRDPEGLVNNRFGVEFADFTTPEYSRYDKITEKKWESCRGLGFSFGYNQAEGPEHVIAPDKLIALLIDVVSKNGNLLLNIGPRPDGSISDIQMDRLRALGSWLDANGEGIFGSRPWVRAAAKGPGGEDVRFTRKGDAVWAFLLARPAGRQVAVPGVMAAEGTAIRTPGVSQDLAWKQNGRDLAVTLPERLPDGSALALRITPAPWQVVRD